MRNVKRAGKFWVACAHGGNHHAVFGRRLPGGRSQARGKNADALQLPVHGLHPRGEAAVVRCFAD
jgi:hypothetical protein